MVSGAKIITLLILAEIGASFCYTYDEIRIPSNRSKIHITIDVTSNEARKGKGKNHDSFTGKISGIKVVNEGKGGYGEKETEENEQDAVGSRAKYSTKQRLSKELNREKKKEKTREHNKPNAHFHRKIHVREGKIKRKNGKAKQSKNGRNYTLGRKAHKGKRVDRQKGRYHKKDNNQKTGQQNVKINGKKKANDSKKKAYNTKKKANDTKNKANDTKNKANDTKKKANDSKNKANDTKKKANDSKILRAKERKKGKFVPNPEGSPRPKDLKIPLTFNKEDIGSKGSKPFEYKKQTKIKTVSSGLNENETSNEDESNGNIKIDARQNNGQKSSEKYSNETTMQLGPMSRIKDLTKQIVIATLKEVNDMKNLTIKNEINNGGNNGANNPILERLGKDSG